MATNPSINYIRGDTTPIAITLTTTAGVAHDLSLATKATLSVKATLTDSNYLMQLSATIPIAPGTDGIVVFPAPTTQVSEALTPATAFYDIEIQFSGGTVVWTPINQGQFIIAADVTHPNATP